MTDETAQALIREMILLGQRMDDCATATRELTDHLKNSKPMETPDYGELMRHAKDGVEALFEGTPFGQMLLGAEERGKQGPTERPAIVRSHPDQDEEGERNAS